MKKVVLTYGLISGSIVATLILLSLPLWNAGILNFDNGEITGYTTIVVSLSLVFFGIKTYRDKYSNGMVSFGQAVKVGLLITLIASVMYGLAWEISFANMSKDFITQMTEHRFAEMKADGATDAELAEAREQWAAFAEYYKNPIIRFLMTITVEIMPIGIVITLISAALLRKKEFLPITEPA